MSRQFVYSFCCWLDLVVVTLFCPNNDSKPQPLDEITVEQPPDDVEIEPDEQTDAFTVSESAGSYTHSSSGTLRIAFSSCLSARGTNMSLCCLVLMFVLSNVEQIAFYFAQKNPLVLIKYVVCLCCMPAGLFC